MSEFLTRLKAFFTHKYVKLGVTIVLNLLILYIIYAMIMNLVVWSWQPRFVLADGTRTSSLGFFVQFAVYAVFFLVFSAIDIIVMLAYYKKPKQPKALKPKQPEH